MAERRLRFAIPGDLDSLTGGYLYDKRLIAEMGALGWSVTHLAWPESFPEPDGAAMRAAADGLAACPDGALVLIDGLAFGVMPDILAAEADRLILVALVHHPLALESGLAEDRRRELITLERRALTFARAIIVTSETTAATLIGDYGVARGRIAVAKPGVDRPEAEPVPKPEAATIKLLSIGSVTPRKGFDILVDALARITELDWTCVIAGSLDRAPVIAVAIQHQIDRLGQAGRITLLGERDDLAPLYGDADIFVLPSRHEGYGMVLAEAMAYGLPIVATEAGAIPEVVPQSSGILVPVDDAAALADALGRVMRDADLRGRLAAGARDTARRSPSWRDSAALIASAISLIGPR